MAWATASADALRRADRAVAGGWPGTMTESRALVLAALREDGCGDAISVERLRALSRIAYRSARAAWQHAAEPDLEP